MGEDSAQARGGAVGGKGRVNFLYVPNSALRYAVSAALFFHNDAKGIDESPGTPE